MKKHKRLTVHLIGLCAFGFALSTLFTIASLSFVLAFMLAVCAYMLGHTLGIESGRGSGEAMTHLSWMRVVRPIVEEPSTSLECDELSLTRHAAYCYMCCKSGSPGEDDFHTESCAYKRMTREGLEVK